MHMMPKYQGPTSDALRTELACKSLAGNRRGASPGEALHMAHGSQRAPKPAQLFHFKHSHHILLVN